MPACPACATPIPDHVADCPSCGRPVAVHVDDAVTGFAPAAAAASLLDDAVTGYVPVPSTPRSVSVGSGTLQKSSASGRFVPGTLLAGRYRLIGLLGRGGMGEVYRAEDLLLAQEVALKFLPPDLSGDPERLAHFRAEVRTARDVSHPNVCRVYDIGEISGEHFLSMEYIDGENLASLLRRIGRLPQDKGIEIARQLCAGLAAAHDRGVLHRDLKPANVMLDGRGHVRLADFGLAGAAPADQAAPAALAGTPAYMAPEQFQGRPASVQSDIYALGLVLYEIFTGKPVVSGNTIAELARQHREQHPSSMTGIVAELDPAIERMIHRCLEKDPADRPASALSVSAGLPGGDPLAAAIARGETPSPELVAASGEVGILSPLLAIGLVAVVLAGLAATIAMFDRAQVTRITPMPRPPEVLRDRARQIATALGYPTPQPYLSSGFAYSSYLGHLAETRTYRPDLVRSGRPPAVAFWYRESPTPLSTNDFATGGRVSPVAPAAVVAGMLEVVLDSSGRLRGFSAVPSPGAAAGSGRETDWSAVFRAMDLDPSRFAAAAPARLPPVFADARAAWTGAYPESPGTQVRVEAASLGGRVVHAEVVEPWTRPAGVPRTGQNVFNDIVVPLVFFGLLAGALLLAIRNARLNRGDRRGAFRVSLAIVAVVFLRGLMVAERGGGVSDSMVLIFFALSRALLFGGLLWLAYFALEPPVRRHSPQTLISWSRLLAGRWRDPLVARDVLAGCALGVLAQALFSVKAVMSGEPVMIEIGSLDGARFALAVLVGRVSEAVMLSTGILLGLFVLTVLLRKRWIAVALVMVFFGVNNAGGTLANWPQALVVAGIVGLLLLGLVRLGLLTLIVSVLVTNLSASFAVTFDRAAWYSGATYLVVGFILALTLFAFWRATPVRGLVNRLLSE
jgi:hypothetical protein